MTSYRIDRLLDYLTGPQLVWGVLWLGLVLVTIALMALMVTRWGQSRPLGKCVALSLFTHALLATYAMTIEIVGATPHEALVRATVIDETPNAEHPDSQTSESSGDAEQKPWERMPSSSTTTQNPLLDRPEIEAADESERMPNELPPLLPGELPQDAVAESEPSKPTPDPFEIEEPATRDQAAAAEPIEAPTAMRREA